MVLGSFETVPAWTSAGTEFDFTSPTVMMAASALDGNAEANRVAGLGGTISGVTWNASDTLWVRWIEVNDTGSDHGLALDNVTFSAGGGIGGQDGDFDGDGDVDGRDFLVWQRGGSLLEVRSVPSDLADWQNNYGVGRMAAVGAVPEPASWDCWLWPSCRGLWPQTLGRTIVEAYNGHARCGGHGCFDCRFLLTEQ